LLRSLCWTLVVFAVVSAAVSLAFTAGLIVPQGAEDIVDLVERIAAFRANDAQVYPFALIVSLANAIVFLVVALLGGALRRLVEPGSGRDVMTSTFIVAGVLGVASSLAFIAVTHFSAHEICDCLYREEQYIAQDYAILIGWDVASWLANGALVVVGIAAVLAARLIDAGSAFRTVSYLIAVVLIGATVLRVLNHFLPNMGFDLLMILDIVVSLTTGILVPIWAILLARSVADADSGPDAEPVAL
jgi:hypothetical protein